ncbi:hypothetical protein [Priestia megaterium]|uniref:Uncharacterized protein n=1 Tax=Priestia megaterium TaxID=1404 RepID=A0A6M6E5J0_PRIMG|nr:hypothetical protein [Priestia megaterium]QJX80399.1 hypothetical protein FDZ14_30395 [Priestia megaterium]
MNKKIQNEQSDNWVEIYTDDYDFESCSIAKILADDSYYYLLANVTPRGKSDGLYLLKHDDVVGLQRNTAYINKVKTLYHLKQENHLEYNGEKQNLLLGLLHFAKQKELIISVVMGDSDLYGLQGFVKDIDEEILTITNVNSFGDEDGESAVLLKDISAIACDDENGSDLKLLHSNK